MALQRVGQPVQRIRALLQQGPHIGAGTARLVRAGALRAGVGQARDRGEPFLDLVIKPVLSPARLQFEKADDQGPARPNSEDAKAVPMPAMGSSMALISAMASVSPAPEDVADTARTASPTSDTTRSRP
jgi:hypothetical protein